MEINRHLSPVEQWRSYLSLKTPVLITFLIIWNLGILIAIFGFSSGFNTPISSNGGIVISITCLLACFFGFSVAISSKIRGKLIEPKRAHYYEGKYFYLLGFIALILAVCTFLFTRHQNV